MMISNFEELFVKNVNSSYSSWLEYLRLIFFYIDDARTYDPVSIRIAAIIIFVLVLDSGNSLKYIIPHSIDTKTAIWVMGKPTVSPRDAIVNIPK